MSNTFEIDNGCLERYNGTEPHVVLPGSVTRIGRLAFLNCKNLISLTHLYCLKNRLSFIFDYQYEAFNGLIPSGIEYQETDEGIVITRYTGHDPNPGIIMGVVEIADRAFEKCVHLRTIVLPAGLFIFYSVQLSSTFESVNRPSNGDAMHLYNIIGLKT